MKFRTHNKKKRAAALIIAALIALLASAMFFTGCQQKATAATFKVTFEVSGGGGGGGGKLTAKVKNKEIYSSKKVEKNETVTFYAAPDSGYEVAGWKIEPNKCKFETGGKPGNTEATLTVSEDVKVTVTFTTSSSGGGGGPVPKVKVTLEKNVGGNVKVTPELPEDGMVSQYTNLTFKALPLTGYKFTKWELDDGETVNEAEYRHSVKKAVKIKAVFTEDDPAIITKHTVTLNPTTKGTVTSDIEPWPNDNQLPEDTEITFTAEPDEDYAVDKWTVTPNSALQAGGTAESATARVKITAATTVEVTFRPTERTYTAGSVSFTMKSIAAVTNGTIGHDERPNNKPHTVNLSAYLIGETEVTQELYQAVMGNNPSFHQGAGHLPDGEEVQEKRPVEKVNWYHAIAFCNKLSLKLGLTPCYTVTVSGSPINFSTLAYTEIPTADNSNWNNAVLDMSKNGFRLPTEAEWEWAAKGGTDYKWAGTNTKSELKNYAWYKNADGGDANGKTHEVKKKLPNGYGLYDMSGNVYEWCWDWYKNETPAGGQTDPMGVDSGFERVKRGGSWDFTTFNAARAYREKSLPDNCNSNNLGLRVLSRP